MDMTNIAWVGLLASISLSSGTAAQEAGRVGAWKFFSTADSSNISTRAVRVPFCLDKNAMIQISCIDGDIALIVSIGCNASEETMRGLFVDEENGLSFPFSMKADGNDRFRTGPNEATRIFADTFAASRRVEIRTGAIVAEFNFYGLDRALAKTKSCALGFLE